MRFNLLFSLALVCTLFACKKDDDTSETPSTDTCTSDQKLDNSRGACDQTLGFSSNYSELSNLNQRNITANSIPGHKVGLFGRVQGSLNPNAIKEQTESYSIKASPQVASSYTSLMETSGANAGPVYAFGILFNGVELDPIAAEPFPHSGIMDPNVNWEWNLEALNVQIGLDCNSAHVQPSGKYHYHGKPSLFLDGLNVTGNKMVHIGYAADGFPIYYKYAYDNASDSTSGIRVMKPSYQLKSGKRSGDGKTAPCGSYDGVYSNDYEFDASIGDLDKANGRTGVTPEFPGGTYYYVLTDEFPAIPRYFKGTPSADFKLRP